jgi:DNA invertase Pin-like site-specific DNA recombinase
MKQAKTALYTRISGHDQSSDGQLHELKEYANHRGWEVVGVYSDTISGVKNSRPALDKLMKDAAKLKFDIVLTWRIDRLGRSVSHLLDVLETLRKLGIEYASLSEQIDTSTPAGKMVFTVLGAVAELERNLTVDRVRMGLANARRRGVQLGRPPIKKLTPGEIEQIRAARLKGVTLRELSKTFGASLWSVHRASIPK